MFLCVCVYVSEFVRWLDGRLKKKKNKKNCHYKLNTTAMKSVNQPQRTVRKSKRVSSSTLSSVYRLSGQVSRIYLHTRHRGGQIEATRCGPCYDEMVSKKRKEERGSGHLLLFINSWQGEARETTTLNVRFVVVRTSPTRLSSH